MEQISSDAHVHINSTNPNTEKASAFKALNSHSTEFLVSTQPIDWPYVCSIAATHRSIYAAIGLHPWFVTSFRDDKAWLGEMRKLLEGDTCLHVGEIGLDRSKRHSAAWEAQKECFSAQLHLCCEFQRCCAIHCVRGHGELLRVLVEMDRSSPILPTAINLHSWSGSVETAAAILRLRRMGPRIYFGFSASVNLRNLMQYALVQPVELERKSWPKLSWYPCMTDVDSSSKVHAKVDGEANANDGHEFHDYQEKIWVNLETQERRKQPWRVNERAWNAFQTRVKHLPIDRLLVESDLSGFEPRQAHVALMVAVLSDATNVPCSQLLQRCENNLAAFLQCSQHGEKDAAPAANVE